MPDAGGAGAQHDQVRAGPVAVGQQAQRQQGVAAAGLDDRERGEQHRRGRERGDDLGIAPVRDPVRAGGRAGQAVDQGGEPAGRGDRAGQVEPAPLPRRLAQHPRRGQGRRQPDGHVDEQHPPPGGVGGQQASGDQADGAAGDAHRGVHAHRPVPGRALREGGRDQRERGRRDRRGACALDGAGREQPRLGGGEPARQRSRREQQQPGYEHLAAAEQVPGPAGQQQQPAEGQRVGVDHPFQAGAGKAERVLDVRQRDVDDRRVQQHHQLRGRYDEQGQAEAGTGCPGPRGTRGNRPPGYGSRLRHEGFSLGGCGHGISVPHGRRRWRARSPGTL